MKEYVVTEDQLYSIDGTSNDEVIFNEIRSRPYTAASGREQVLDELSQIVKHKRVDTRLLHQLNFDPILEGICRGYDAVLRDIAELRKQGEQR